MNGTVVEPAARERQPAERALAWIRQNFWAIEPGALETIVAIATRELADRELAAIEAIQSRAGQPLAGTRGVEVREGGIALVSLTGPLFRYANLFTQISGATSLERTALEFSKAVQSDDVRGIVLAIDSPGGEVSGVHEFARMVHAARDAKPVVAYVSDRAASAAYWIAAAASKIVLDATASVGSIGVIARVVKSDDRNVIEVVSQQSPYKRVDVATDAGRDHVQRHVDRLAQIFVESVAEFRGVNVDAVLQKFGQGGVLVGTDAVAAGMANRLGSLESTIAGLSGKSKETRRMTTQAVGPEVTRELIAEKYPAVASAFREEGKRNGIEEGARCERERIQGVLKHSRPGHEALLHELAFDGKTSPDAAAARVLDAMGTADRNRLAALQKDGSTVAAAASVVDPTKAETQPQKSTARSPVEVAARAREIVAEKAAKGITISAAAAVALAERE